mmetsp:Transcript_7265/g.13396  ORF Transcript_7265/g.13396 Transcript_7265/m.13396 type:complete len:364 (+) Transcript_7265:81-1172(+)
MATESIRDRIKGALYGLLIADALAAPTHWFYGGQRQVVSVYGSPIRGYVKPCQHLEGSIMSKSNTGGGGRGGFKGSVVGDVIFHGKKKYWEPGADYHYHNLLGAGDNTLEGLLVRRAALVTAKQNGNFDPDAIIEDYISFMTTPETHNDTYAGTCHRMFFANYASGKPPNKCPDNDRHNVDTIDALVTSVPIALVSDDDASAVANAADMILLTRDSPTSVGASKLFTKLLRKVIRGVDLREALRKSGKELHIHFREGGEDPMTACYMDSALPATFVMAYKYAPREGHDLGEAFREGVLANANRGGENVGSGALLGALWGGSIGFSKLPDDLVKGLAPNAHAAIEKEIESFLDAIPFTSMECKI